MFKFVCELIISWKGNAFSQMIAAKLWTEERERDKKKVKILQ